MPGIFGWIGSGSDPGSKAQSFLSRFPDATVVKCDAGFIGAESASGRPALFSRGALHLAVDGDPATFSYAEGSFGSVEAPSISPEGCGNLARLDASSALLEIVTECTGSFPLYYALHDQALLFSSSLRALGDVGAAGRDLVGTLEFLRYGYKVGGRTFFKGVRRVLPGQSLTYDARARTLRVAETSSLWAGAETSPEGSETISKLASILDGALARNVAGERTLALMLSGGWDSRTLVASLRRSGTKSCLAYAHGDVDSREFSIIRRICESQNVPLHAEPLTRASFHPDFLSRSFDTVESVVFPHWLHAGRVLATIGADCATAGTYGEVLGGHYGISMFLHGRDRVVALMASFLGWSGQEARSRKKAREALRENPLHKPWYLARDAWGAMARAHESINADVEAEFARLERRGVVEPMRALECFVAENRGSQHINTQLLSLRSGVEVCMPFADRELLAIATRLPLRSRLHNRLNRALLRNGALERLPLAATLIPAGAPILAQESSRVLRKAAEDGQWWLARRAGGLVGPPRFGWLNFEFLRDAPTLNAIADDLRCDLWDRDEIRARIVRETRSRSAGSIHPLVYQLLTVSTVDRMYR